MIDQETIDCWKINYGLDKRTPEKASQWWSDQMHGMAPAGAVGALGMCLAELDALRAEVERMREVIGKCHEAVGEDAGSDDGTLHNGIRMRAEGLRREIADNINLTIENKFLNEWVIRLLKIHEGRNEAMAINIVNQATAALRGTDQDKEK